MNENNEELNIDINEIREKAIYEAKEKKHEWRQRGNIIICISCQNRHGFYISPNKILVGVKDGKPVLKNRK